MLNLLIRKENFLFNFRDIVLMLFNFEVHTKNYIYI